MPHIYSFHYNSKRDVVYRRLGFLGFPNYRVGTDGSFWSRYEQHEGIKGAKIGLKWKRITKQWKRKYQSVALHQNGKKIETYIHRLVLLAFVGPCPPGMECRHFPDRDPTNNRLENLQWGTSKENKDDKKKHGTNIIVARGERSGKSKITNKTVEWLRKENKSPLLRGKYRTITKRLKTIKGIDLSENQVRLIIIGKYWSHI